MPLTLDQKITLVKSVGEEITTEAELSLITDINGYSIETLNDVIYARTGYRDFEQLKEEMEEE